MGRLSYPVGEGPGTYSATAYQEVSDALDAAEASAADPGLSQAEADDVLARIAEAETALDETLNLKGDGVTYNAHRSFEFDQAGKVPYGIAVEALTNGATALVTEEEGNTFLRLKTEANGKANLFLPYMGSVTASDGDQIVITYRARANSDIRYVNGAMVRNDSGTGNYSMVTAFDRGKIMVQNGTARPQLDAIEPSTWNEITMITDWESKKYSVLLDGVEIANGYDFRHTGGEKLTGQRFGIDGFANTSIDFDDFRVQVRSAVVAEAVTFLDRPGVRDDTFTVPETVGVEYLRDDEVLAAGPHPGKGLVSVTARAAQGYVLAEDSAQEWSHTFSEAGTEPPMPPADPTDPPVAPKPEADGSLALTGGELAPLVWGAGVAATLLLIGTVLLVLRRRRNLTSQEGSDQGGV